MKLEVYGPGEIAERFGVTKMTVAKWQHREDFPEPDAVLRIGPVWRKSTIDRWAIRTGRKG